MLGSLEITFVLKTSADDMLKRIQKSAEKHLNTRVRRVKKIFEEKLPKMLEDRIKSSFQYRILNIDLRGDGELCGQLGIPDLADRLDGIIHHWCHAFEPEGGIFRFTNRGVEGFYRIKFIKTDYSDVLSLPEAHALVDSLQDGHMSDIPWLSWLLLGGAQTLVRDYIYVNNEFTQPYSRTGIGIMVEKPGRGWKIPDEYIGTENNNFLTNCLDEVLEVLNRDIDKMIDKASE